MCIRDRVEIVGDAPEKAQIAAAGALLPGTQLVPAGQASHLFKRAAKAHVFEKVAKVAQDAMQAENLGALQRARRTAGLNGQGMRPFACLLYTSRCV